jgi:hypothetical protein
VGRDTQAPAPTQAAETADWVAAPPDESPPDWWLDDVDSVPSGAAATPPAASSASAEYLEWFAEPERAGSDLDAAFQTPEEYAPEAPGEAWTAESRAEPLWEDSAPEEALSESPPALPRSDLVGQDGLPLGERASAAEIVEFPYQVAFEVERLIPQAPEMWPESAEFALPVEMGDQSVDFALADELAPVEEHEGGLITPAGAVVEEQPPVEIPDPFASPPARLPAETLFDGTARPDPKLLAMLVDDDRIRKLSEQIEALQEELADHVQSDRGAADSHQQELLRASSLLMASRRNYDDARAIVYRVRADMNRQTKVEADIMRYRPLLLNYFIGWGVALAVLFFLKALFAGITEAVGVGVFAALYYPMLFGIVGALLSGYLTLERHTTKLRDFDPFHVSWYLFNPLLGGVMGLLMFLIASIANEDLLKETASEAERAIAYLLCVVGGMNQNSVLGQLNDLLKRFGRSSGR